jgi:hypothetical protein
MAAATHGRGRALVGDGPQHTEVAAVNRRGRQIVVRVVCSPLMDGGSQAVGLGLLGARRAAMVATLAWVVGTAECS